MLDASAGSILEDAEACLNFVKARKLIPTSDPNPTMPEEPDRPQAQTLPDPGQQVRPARRVR